MSFLNAFGRAAAAILGLCVAVHAQDADPISQLLRSQQRDLATEGKAFLLDEARRASFLLIGGLHGDRETPALVQTLAAGTAPFGYRYLAVEMSPWAASRLEASLKLPPGAGGIKGADIEEIQPQLLIRDLAAANPGNSALQSMVELTKAGYKRDQAAQLLKVAREIGGFKDVSTGGFSLYGLIVATLEVESARVGNQRFAASLRREAFMKQLFVAHYRAAMQAEAKPKFIVTFGQSHLGRGIDQRGVSTLGNFIGELATAEGVQSFHVVLFAAGGKYSLGGLHDIDQRKDEPAFAFLAELARYPVTVFDVRAIRPLLHGLAAPLTPRDASLVYWSDSYDAIICYREVTPAGGPPR